LKPVRIYITDTLKKKEAALVKIRLKRMGTNLGDIDKSWVAKFSEKTGKALEEKVSPQQKPR